MARRVPDERLEQLITVATRVFVERGYRRTQMADVAEAMGIAKGTLYLYVESKEALFDLVVRHADAPPARGARPAFPIRTPKRGATLRYVRGELERNQPLATLAAALAHPPSTDARTELAGIVRELYHTLARNRRRLKLVDTSARDHPELAALWFDGARGGLFRALERYLTDRIRRGLLRMVPDPKATARLVVEIVAFWAIHRHWDAHPEKVTDEVAERTVVDFVLAALVKERVP